MVAHFQKLFDVPMQAGVYARMNDVYVRLAEMQNIYRSLKTSLGLSKLQLWAIPRLLHAPPFDNALYINYILSNVT